MSAVPDEQSAEVGGLQNTATNLGASIGTALAGAVLISALTASFLTGIQNNPDVPDRVVAQAADEARRRDPVHLRRGPQAALDDAHVPPKTADAIVEENSRAGSTRCASPCRSLAVVALVALLFTARHPDGAARSAPLERSSRSSSSPTEPIRARTAWPAAPAR